MMVFGCCAQHITCNNSIGYVLRANPVCLELLAGVIHYFVPLLAVQYINWLPLLAMYIYTAVAAVAVIIVL